MISNLNGKDWNLPINNSPNNDSNAPIIANHGASYTDKINGQLTPDEYLQYNNGWNVAIHDPIVTQLLWHKLVINPAIKVNNIVEAPLGGQSLNNHYFANEETFLQKRISGKNTK